MAGGGGGPAAASSVEDGSPAPLDGAFLLQLLRNPPRAQPTAPLAAPPPYGSPQRQDPAVQAVGPSFPFLPHNFLHPPPPPPPNPLQVPPGFQRPSWAQPAYPSPPLPFIRGDVRQPGQPAGGFATPPTSDRQRDSGFRPPDGVSANRMHRNIPSSKSSNSGSLSRGREEGSSANAQKQKAHMAWAHGPLDRNHYHGEQPRSAPPSERRTVEFQRSGVTEQARQPGPLRRPTKGSIGWFPTNERWERMHDDGVMEESYRERNQRVDSYSYMERDLLRGESPASNANRCLDRPLGAAGSSRSCDDGSEVEEPLDESQDDNGIDGQAIRSQRDERKGEMNGSASRRAALRVQEQIMESLILEDEPAGKGVVRRARTSRGKEIRFDTLRGHHISSQRMRIRKRVMECRRDIESLTPLFLTIYESLIPAEEEKAKQKQLLLSLEKLVNREWPKAQLHLYGSCANSFGVSNSDIDVCLAIGDDDMSKSEILLKLADILQSDNLQNVQALTHARVPIVKLMDPVTGISCDICINNLLAVVNTKLLRDYAHIDDRLRQLAFIVKHWAKSRGVNETYRGTLSSYAYVLMCIHFLQLRKPAVLPCLQQMETTYVVTIDDTECAYFDQVEKLHNFGAQNKESIARLLWAFFHYWAYYHDYANDVISVRTGNILSKRVKDWTRRIGNDRHLICIEDPFEISHDLGRVVDKYSIKVLREEFERAADILQYDPNPSVTLFEPYMPGSPQDQLHSNLDDL